MIEPHASTGILQSLGINGWQFFAQLINFSIVLFVMWKWVYTPLLAVMEKRTKEIKEGLENAKRADQRLQDATEEKERMLKEARVEARTIVEDVEAKAEALRQERLAISKIEIEKHIADAKKQIQHERDAAAAALKKDVAQLVVAATEKIAEGMTEEQKKALASHAIQQLAK